METTSTHAMRALGIIFFVLFHRRKVCKKDQKMNDKIIQYHLPAGNMIIQVFGLYPVPQLELYFKQL